MEVKELAWVEKPFQERRSIPSCPVAVSCVSPQHALSAAWAAEVLRGGQCIHTAARGPFRCRALALPLPSWKPQRAPTASRILHPSNPGSLGAGSYPDFHVSSPDSHSHTNLDS